MGEKSRLYDAFGVMPGLVPGIHVVKECSGFRTSNLSLEAARAIGFRPQLRVPTWMAGTSPAMTRKATIKDTRQCFELIRIDARRRALL
jgi:hypothetical protein